MALDCLAEIEGGSDMWANSWVGESEIGKDLDGMTRPNGPSLGIEATSDMARGSDGIMDSGGTMDSQGIMESQGIMDLKYTSEALDAIGKTDGFEDSDAVG